MGKEIPTTQGCRYAALSGDSLCSHSENLQQVAKEIVMKPFFQILCILCVFLSKKLPGSVQTETVMKTSMQSIITKIASFNFMREMILHL